MWYTISHQGVPIGEADLDLGPEVTVGAVRPLPGYAAVQPLVRAATDALRGLGYLGAASERASDAAGRAALARGATLGRALELRDARGTLVTADFVELMEWPGAESEVTAVTAWVRAREAPAAVPARERPAPGAAQGGARPEA
jgi:hypothetical protein